MILLAIIVVVFIPEYHEFFHRPNASLNIYASFYTFRFLLMLLLTVLSTAVAIKILR
jgi:hypothetical protein